VIGFLNIASQVPQAGSQATPVSANGAGSSAPGSNAPGSAPGGLASVFDDLVQEISGNSAGAGSFEQAPVFQTAPFSQATSSSQASRPVSAQASAVSIPQPGILNKAAGFVLPSFALSQSEKAAPTQRTVVWTSAPVKTAGKADRAAWNVSSGKQPAAERLEPIETRAGKSARPTEVASLKVADEPEENAPEAAVSARTHPEHTMPEVPIATAVETVATPVAAGPVRKAAATPAQGNKAVAPAQPQAPFVFIPMAVPVPPAPIPFALPAKSGNGGSDESGGAARAIAGQPESQPESKETAEKAAPSDIALQVNIKMPNETGPEPVAAKQEPLRASLPETPVVPAAQAPTAPTPAAQPAMAVHTEPSAAPQTRAAEDSPASHAPVTAEPVGKEPAQQPLKSLSLEFAPDGAGDVRVRVSERAGEVHISLHSADASLSGKLHDGVHDLVGSLSKAGYEAEAWTPNQGQQGGNQRQQEQRRQAASPKGSGDDFGGIFEQQPTQENS
jgi:hypothetical protein